MSNHINWKIFISYILGFLTLTGLAAGTANAAPSCTMKKDGQRVTITIADTGMVLTGGAQPPAGAVTYPGTGRAGDVAMSCNDNQQLCASAKWVLRFADAAFGWPGDNVLTSDERAVQCTYDTSVLAQVCAFDLKAGQKTRDGKVRMHFSSVIGDQVVAAYQPQAGCKVEKDEKGNPHAIISAAAN